MRVLIYEPQFWGGHNLNYVKHLVRTLATWPVRVTVATGEGAEVSPAFLEQLAPFSKDFDLAAVVPGAQRGQDWGAHYYHALIDVLDRLKPDHVFIPSGDIVAAYAGSRRLRQTLRRPRTTLEIDCNVIASFHRSTIPWRRVAHSLRTSVYASFAPWTRSFTCDAFVSVGNWPWRWIHGSTPTILPDPVDLSDGPAASKRAAREALGLPVDGMIVGCAGHFASHGRKNPVALVRGFLEADLGEKTSIALMGVLPQELLDYVDTLGPERSRVVIVNRFLAAREFELAVSALDLACLPYVNFDGTSGILLYAAALGRPVLASPTPWFRSMIPRFGLGWTSDLSDEHRIAEALRRYQDLWMSFTPSPRAQQLAKFCHWKNYANLFASGLRERLNLPPVPTVSWPSVVDSSSS